eukprot:TRINITY_DN6463_c0_g2_i1.p1 TRINITY_DN6463_c0_g2~~TRINITY_DN6463_c0_g2_i1.p1  ORF type:complete len:247 (-),score=29.56 TRINITY_DN6463_c0_g2_i1:156-896(-)
MLPPLQGVADVAPESVLAYKPMLYLLSVGYAIVLLLCFYGGSENFLNYAFVFLAAFLMASRPNECGGKCVVPFFGLAFMSLVFDLITVVSLLSREYPGAGYIFSTSCPTDITAILRKNTTIYLRDAKIPGDAAYVVPASTKVSLPENVCDTAWVVSNLALFLGALMDLAATVLGRKILSGMADGWPGVTGLMQPPNDAGVFGGPGGGGGFAGQLGPGPGDQPVGGRGLAQRAQNFPLFQGPGQTLG